MQREQIYNPTLAGCIQHLTHEVSNAHVRLKGKSPLPRLFHHSVHGDRTVEPRTPPKGRSFPWVSLPLLVIAEQTTLCVACSIACQRYHTPESPHLRPNKDGLDAHWWLIPPKLVKSTAKRGSRGVSVLLGSAVGRGPHMGGR